MSKYAHSFAKKWLKHAGWEIYSNGKRILDCNQEVEYPVLHKIRPYYVTGEEFKTDKNEENIIEIGYNQLLTMGVCIDSRPAEEPKFFGHTRDYCLKEYRGVKGVNTLPKTLKIQYDINNQRARLIRERVGATEWFELKGIKARSVWKKDMSDWERVQRSDTLFRNLAEKTMGVKSKRNVVLEGILMMILDNGKLLCLPMGEKDDVGHIEFSGASGFGKTMGMHCFLHGAYYMTDWYFYLINDAVRQTYSWTKVDNNCIEYQRFGFKPMPLPIVPLALNKVDADDLFFSDEGLSQRFTLPYESESFKDFLEGMPKDRNMDLGKSGRYLSKLDFIRNARTEEEILEGLKQSIDPDAGIPKNSLPKIASIIGAFAKKGIYDIWSDVPSKWLFKYGVKNTDMLPYIGLAEAGVIPSLDTSEDASAYYYAAYIKSVMVNIYNHQKSKSKSENKRKGYLLIDEIPTFYGNGKKRMVSADIIDDIVAMGRNYNLAMVFTLQPHSILSDKMRTSVRYHFAFHNTEEQASQICHDYGIGDKMMIKTISNLKEFECVAISNEFPFLLYDPITGECVKKSGAFRGRIFIPPSLHKRPSDKVD